MGKKVSFQIAKDSVEGPTHHTERTEENEVQADPDVGNGPHVKLEEKVIKDKSELTHVEKGNFAITGVGNDKVDPTNTPQAKGQLGRSSKRRFLLNACLKMHQG